MKNIVLKHLDEPVRILSFSIGDLIGYLTPFFVGSLFDSLFVIPSFGIAFIFMLKKVAKRFPRFYAIRYLYWSLPAQRFNRMMKTNLPPSHKQFLTK